MRADNGYGGSKIVMRIVRGFSYSALAGMIVNLLIDLVVGGIFGVRNFESISPFFLSYFDSQSVAVYINILLYGIIGAAFSGMTFIFECDRIGFVLQNTIYYIATACVWGPIIFAVWQLHRVKAAMYGSLAGFLVTYAIMTVVGYREARRDVEKVNDILSRDY